jgi:hypothetical protein
MAITGQNNKQAEIYKAVRCKAKKKQSRLINVSLLIKALRSLRLIDSGHQSFYYWKLLAISPGGSGDFYYECSKQS